MLKTDLDKIGRFSDQDFESVSKLLIAKQLSKNELLLQQGQICQSAFFISSGSAYQFRYDDIDEKVSDLHMTGEWCLNYVSFISQIPTKYSIKANSQTRIFELSMHAIHHLIAISPAFLQLGKILDGALTRTQYLDNAMTPSEKYNHLINSRPQVLQIFPLKIIASYLNMTPETLSRVRSSF
ncbi:Crp/Fnr family transcriptional regulator [Dyadobacter psychrotolerans]|uniref:Crp/Fnr family transcriptional regulator n=1 Tax=Dyadobacter psychrotolerans TaxID=2541721 RepID=A0A4R5DC74_9BACT|nr:Crp/Fnr family transcriptional regulator [Dyadobacter psychrotolerans]TDE09600.1 Crp/Fnr family transcriptional regulator [Dyadobacter psychrotolerans]